jgi:hypothetical protein
MTECTDSAATGLAAALPDEMSVQAVQILGFPQKRGLGRSAGSFAVRYHGSCSKKKIPDPDELFLCIMLRRITSTGQDGVEAVDRAVDRRVDHPFRTSLLKEELSRWSC